jgi:hypothetical protein
MRSRAVRFALQALFVALLAAASYVMWQQESKSVEVANAALAFDQRARALTRSFLEIKSAQPGYVAAGQGEDYWFARVAALIGSTREELTALQAQARIPQARTEIDTAIAALEDFGQMDRRAREYVRGGQRLLASDLVFSDGIEKMDAAAAAIERAQVSEKAAADLALTALRHEQLLAVGGAAALGLLIVFVLVPLPRSEPPAVTASLSARDAPPPARPAAPLSIASGPAPAPPKPAPVRPAAPARMPAPAGVLSNAKPSSPGVDLAGIAALCSDLARVFDTRALPAALERAAVLLNASGLVIWVADPDGRELAPVMAHGYPQHQLSRMGTIPKDAENATAAAFRTGLVQIVKADDISHGAIAAPLLSPSGPVGVMAAELLQDGERREGTRAAAAIVAAQLSTLMGPPPARAQAHTEVTARV